VAFKVVNDIVIKNDTNINVDGMAVLVGDGDSNTKVLLQNVQLTTNIFQDSNLTTDNLTEGTSNLYFTDLRAQAALAGDILNLQTNIGVGDTDTLIAAQAYADSVIVGSLDLSGHIIPTIDSDGTTGFDIGSPSKKWRDLYLSEGSLYINNQKVIEDSAGTIIVRSNTDQSLLIKTEGTGVLTLESDSTINISSTLQIQTGKRITDSGGNAIQFGDKIDMDNNQIINVGAPTNATDGVNKSYVDSTISTISTNAITEGDSQVEIADLGTGTVIMTVDGAQRFTLSATNLISTVPMKINSDNVATEVYVDTAEADAKAYTDARETAIISTLSAYTDQAEADAISTASADATSKANTAQTAAEVYTDARETAITTAYQTYADQAEVDAISTAATDATTKDTLLQTAMQTYADQAEVDAVSTANSYTDQEIVSVTSALETYSDTSELDAIAAANVYTDARETAITTAYQTYADQTEVDAKAYTDTRETAITTAYQTYADQAEVDAVTASGVYTDARETAITTAYQTYADQAEVDAVSTANSYTDTAVANVIDSAPAVLDTLNELAAALGDDANFATTVSNDIGTKVSKTGDTMTGDLTLAGAPSNANHAASKAYVDSAVSGGTGALDTDDIAEAGNLYYTNARVDARIPTNVSSFTNDSSYATTSQLFSGSYTDLSNKPTIPTNNNQLTNGAGYITSFTNTTYTAGTGLTLVGTEFRNTAPDQTVSLTGSGATSISGTYPNFTISSTDTNTNTTYSTATSSTLGLVKIGYGENGKNYPVELSSGKMFVNVPWVDTNTDTNTTYTAGNGISLSSTTFSVAAGNGLTQEASGLKMDSSYTGDFEFTGDLEIEDGYIGLGSEKVIPAISATGTSNDVGINLAKSGKIMCSSNPTTANTSSVFYVNRVSTDGDLIRFNQTGSTKGTIGIDSGQLYIDSDSLILRHDGTDTLVTSSTGVDVTGDFTASGDVCAYSDRRLKRNIETIDNAIDKVNNLRGVTYEKSLKPSLGVIAQEVEEVLPELVKTDSDGMKSVAYGNMVGLLIEAIKEQQKQIEELKNKCKGL